MTLDTCSLHKSKSFLKYKFKTVTIGKMITLFRKCGHCLWILLTISNNLLPTTIHILSCLKQLIWPNITKYNNN